MTPKERGVSPVIATILMVSITVVLVAMVYIMISGMMSGITDNQIFGSFANKEKVDTTSYKLIFSEFKPATHLTSLKTVLMINSTYTYNVIFSSDYDRSTATIDPLDSNTQHLRITYHDTSNNTYINTGDYMLVENLHPNISYQIYILDSSGNTITSISFEV